MAGDGVSGGKNSIGNLGGGGGVSPRVFYYGGFSAAPAGSSFYCLNRRNDEMIQNVESQNRIILTKHYKLKRLRMYLLTTIVTGIWGFRKDGVTVASLPLNAAGEIDSGVLDIDLPAGSAVCFIVTCTLGSGVSCDKAFAELEQVD